MPPPPGTNKFINATPAAGRQSIGSYARDDRSLVVERAPEPEPPPPVPRWLNRLRKSAGAAALCVAAIIGAATAMACATPSEPPSLAHPTPIPGTHDFLLSAVNQGIATRATSIPPITHDQMKTVCRAAENHNWPLPAPWRFSDDGRFSVPLGWSITPDDRKDMGDRTKTITTLQTELLRPGNDPTLQTHQHALGAILATKAAHDRGGLDDDTDPAELCATHPWAG